MEDMLNVASGPHPCSLRILRDKSESLLG